MVFSSIIFILFFLPVLLLTYYFTPNRYKNILLLAFSIFFYSWGAPKFIFVILATTLVDFYLVKLMDNANNERLRKLLLLLSLSINVGLLFYFKYLNFCIENLNQLFSLAGIDSIEVLKIILPIGISFYTFESLTYVIDVYRKVHKPLTRFWDYQLYIILFPKLIAGPIIRYHEIADQINGRFEKDSFDLKLQGVYCFAIGLAQKVIIANAVGKMADSIFASPIKDIDSYVSWMGAFSYTFQIYFDFAGYSNMAIGIGMMLGFRFPENFNNPYASLNITEFWRRWHMTLGSWMRNYLYIPLGGNKSGKWITYINLWIVFLVSGIWHGASWTFVVWGAYHGLFLVIERFVLSDLLTKIPKVISLVYTFLVVTIGWVFFRSDNLSSAFVYLKKMFSFEGITISYFDSEFYTCFIIEILCSFVTFFKRGRRLQDIVFKAENNYIQKHLSLLGACVFLMILSVSYIAVNNFNPFIYFRF